MMWHYVSGMGAPRGELNEEQGAFAGSGYLMTG